LSPLARTGGFKELSAYHEGLSKPLATGVPLLDQPLKSNGAPNFHHAAYIGISRTLERDALTVIRRRPRWYASSVWKNLRSTFEPAWHYRAIKPSATPIASYAKQWQLVIGAGWAGRAGIYAFMFGVLLALVAAAMWCVRHRNSREADFVVMSICLFHASYVIGIGALLERSENQRFRFGVDPLLAVIALLLSRRLIAYARERRNVAREMAQGTRPQ
jgi:hypothetical protein